MSANLPEGFDSIFRYIAVVSQRAEQLINGAKVRSECRSNKPTLQAKNDVDLGLVEWRVLTQEEIDAQRQAIVDQFRAEVGAEELSAFGPQPAIPDVLQTEPAPAAEAEAEPAGRDEERDDELARLQRLLGLTISDKDENAGEGESIGDDEAENGEGDEDEDEDADSFDLGDEDDLELDVEEESYEDHSFEDDDDEDEDD